MTDDKNTLTYSIHGDPDSVMYQGLQRTIRSVVSGIHPTIQTIDAPVKFILDGSVLAGDVVIDLSSREERIECDADLAGHSHLMELSVAGVPIRADAKDRIAGLDKDPTRMAKVIVRDMSHVQKTTKTVSYILESDVLNDPSILNDASHVGLLTPSGLPMACEKIVMMNACMPFYITPNPGYFNMATIVYSDTVEKFIFDVISMSEDFNSTNLFNIHVKDATFNMDTVSAKNARAIIGSVLRRKIGRDFGFLNNRNVAEKRLLTLAGIKR